MKLGAFSVSLAVKDIAASKAFYEKLGFTQFHGDLEQGWAMMRNESTVIGLFQGMFDTNTLTFNPGWDTNAQNLDEFEDVREIQRKLQEQGLELSLTAEPDSTGPAHLFLLDPDGNPILIDQHR